MLEEIGDRNMLAGVHSNIGQIHYARGEYDNALEYCNRAAPILEEIGDRNAVAGMHINIGAIHYTSGDYDAALEHLNRAYHLFKKIGLQNEMKAATQAIIEVEAAQNKPADLQEAKGFFKAGIEKMKKVFFGPVDTSK